MIKGADNRMFFSFSPATAENLKSDWFRLFPAISQNDERLGEIFDFLVQKYSQKHRFYHNLSHVNSLLSAAEDFKEKFADDRSVKLAIWFHDAVYEPKRTDNEAESARFAAASLEKLEMPEKLIERIGRMILATEKHNAETMDFDGKLFLDLDLGILGADEKIYGEYKRAIRREYSFVPFFLYRRSRRRILENFLSREFLYFTKEMREKCEKRARQNIANEIKELS
jgi:predicted metal-dependent HD superfamily phosphohydrolase